MNTSKHAMHVALNVTDLAASSAFYASLFARQPAKLRDDYAKFELEAPALVLSLNLAPGRPGGRALSHLGVRLESNEELERVRQRVDEAGLSIRLEEQQVDCCYARQDKFWVLDPDGNAWEHYVFHGDVESAPKKDVEQAQACCGPEVACSDEVC